MKVIYLVELFKLCIRISKETDRAAFYNHSGHVGFDNIHIAEGKKGDIKDAEGFRVSAYSVRIYDKYIPHDMTVEFFEETKKDLESILNGDDK